MAYEHQTEECDCFMCLQRKRWEAGEKQMSAATLDADFARAVSLLDEPARKYVLGQ